MEISINIAYWVLVAVMFAGAVGEFIPGIPGSTFILGAIAIWAFITQFSGVGLPVLIVFTILLLSAVVEFVATYWGAKRFGASKWGQIGAIVGLFVGAVGLLPALPFGGPLLGIFIGPFVGAFIGELLFRQAVEEGKNRVVVAFKASVGTVIGSIVGNIIDGTLAIVAVIIFVWTSLPLLNSL